mmetsp:Transcript_60931/g.176281  ORF Transcript_60931/g.176281 Transcript_60931/m.176281 type:complete len:340 (+) Transcript_60931:965-1984(+)
MCALPSLARCVRVALPPETSSGRRAQLRSWRRSSRPGRWLERIGSSGRRRSSSPAQMCSHWRSSGRAFAHRRRPTRSPCGHKPCFPRLFGRTCVWRCGATAPPCCTSCRRRSACASSCVWRTLPGTEAYRSWPARPWSFGWRHGHRRRETKISLRRWSSWSEPLREQARLRLPLWSCSSVTSAPQGILGRRTPWPRPSGSLRLRWPPQARRGRSLSHWRASMAPRCIRRRPSLRGSPSRRCRSSAPSPLGLGTARISGGGCGRACWRRRLPCASSSNAQRTSGLPAASPLHSASQPRAAPWGCAPRVECDQGDQVAGRSATQHMRCLARGDLACNLFSL